MNKRIILLAFIGVLFFCVFDSSVLADYIGISVGDCKAILPCRAAAVDACVADLVMVAENMHAIIKSLIRAYSQTVDRVVLGATGNSHVPRRAGIVVRFHDPELAA